MESMARDLRHPYNIPSTTVLGDNSFLYHNVHFIVAIRDSFTNNWNVECKPLPSDCIYCTYISFGHTHTHTQSFTILYCAACLRQRKKADYMLDSLSNVYGSLKEEDLWCERESCNASLSYHSDPAFSRWCICTVYTCFHIVEPLN